jgi:hypothetical protein
MAREPEVNSVDRYIKSSPRFVLEEHGHCEVPAGCGGVVLRWRNRFTSIPVEFVGAVLGADNWDLRIDNLELTSTRPLLAPGRHVVTLQVQGVIDGEFAVFLWATSPDVGDDPLLWTPGPRGSWRASGTEPDSAAWTDPDFDVSRWAECRLGEIADSDEVPYSVRRARSLGAQPLTLDYSIVDNVLPRVWLRAVFDLPAPE